MGGQLISNQLSMPKTAKAPITELPNGRFRLDISAKLSPTGKRQAPTFPSEAKAKKARKALMDGLRRHGIRGARLSPERATEASRAFKLLPEGRTLIEAVEFARKRWEQQEASLSLGKCLEAFAADREEHSAEYRNDIEKLRRAAKPWEATLVCDLTREELGEWIAAYGGVGRKWNQGRAMVSAVMSFAVEQEWLEANPVPKLKAKRIRKGAPEIVTINQAAASVGRPLQELARTGHPLDHPITFPEGAYLKCLFAQA